MNWDKDIKNSLDAHLSGLHVSERQQAQMFNRIVQGEKPIMKRKISAALVFAIVLVLAMDWGCLAISATRKRATTRPGWKSWNPWRIPTR